MSIAKRIAAFNRMVRNPKAKAYQNKKTKAYDERTARHLPKSDLGFCPVCHNALTDKNSNVQYYCSTRCQQHARAWWQKVESARDKMLSGTGIALIVNRRKGTFELIFPQIPGLDPFPASWHFLCDPLYGPPSQASFCPTGRTIITETLKSHFGHDLGQFIVEQLATDKAHFSQIMERALSHVGLTETYVCQKCQHKYLRLPYMGQDDLCADCCVQSPF